MTKIMESEKVYKTPSVTVDAIVTKENGTAFTEVLAAYDILLITRGRDPFKGAYAFPGGFVDYGEDPKHAVIRELREECSVEGASVELVTVAGDPNRDPRKHVITIAYHVAVAPNAQVLAGDDAATAHWYNLDTVWRNTDQFVIAFDHRQILGEFLNKKFKI